MAKQWQQMERLAHKSLKKLQAEREKQKQLEIKEAEHKTNIIIAISVFVSIVLIVVFITLLRNRREAEANALARKELFNSSVLEVVGRPSVKTGQSWMPMKKGLDLFDEDMGFKTSEDESLIVGLQRDNQIRVFGNSEIKVYKPKLSSTENLVEKENVDFNEGEITVSISMNGRGILEIKIDDLVVKAGSGLFKIIYDKRKDRGEIIVKNGLIEVMGFSRKVKISGFYKVMFSSKKLSDPMSASVIQYDWRMSLK